MAVAGLICMSCLCYVYVWDPYSVTHTALLSEMESTGTVWGAVGKQHTALQYVVLPLAVPLPIWFRAHQHLAPSRRVFAVPVCMYCAAGAQFTLAVLRQQQYVAAGGTAVLVVSTPCYVSFLWFGVAL
jgi:hypothetical protein